MVRVATEIRLDRYDYNRWITAVTCRGGAAEGDGPWQPAGACNYPIRRLALAQSHLLRLYGKEQLSN